MAAVSFVKRWRIPLLKPPHLQGIAASEHQKDRQVKSNKKNEHTFVCSIFVVAIDQIPFAAPVVLKHVLIYISTEQK